MVVRLSDVRAKTGKKERKFLGMRNITLYSVYCVFNTPHPNKQKNHYPEHLLCRKYSAWEFFVRFKDNWGHHNFLSRLYDLRISCMIPEIKPPLKAKNQFPHKLWPKMCQLWLRKWQYKWEDQCPQLIQQR